ncbi:MAG TPA: phage baseplate assembly protein V [Sorangium sp.]|nr:phage baseplate assembly protein V [Sorangium sp.]
MSFDHPSDGDARRHFGVYPAIVTDIVDPDALGRVQVRFPWLGGAEGGSDVRAWATLTTPYADDDQGILVLPAVDTQVLVAFEAGDLRRPYILGACWNGRERLPASPEQLNNKRLWKTRAGSVLEFDDTDGASKVTISMQSGHKLVLDDAAQEVKLVHQNGCSITLSASGQVQVQANATVEVTASAMNVHCGTATFDGMVTCTTLIAQSCVVSPTFTQGAGNIW